MPIDGYIDLLKAICNSDNDEDGSKVIMVYDVLNNYIPIASFRTSRAAAIFFNTSAACINSCISKKNKKKSRYRIERVTI